MAWTPLLGTVSNVPERKYYEPLESAGASTMSIPTLGFDLAKKIFQVHGLSDDGNAVLRKT